MWRRVAVWLEMIKFEHTIFALPFALMAVVTAGEGWPGWGPLGWVLLAMVGARSSAMTMNRILDLRYDAANPRTAARALPAGVISVGQAWLFALATAAALVLAAGMLNRLALWLSPLALLVIWGYSYTKRFTQLSHLVLGLALGVAPSAAWIALTGTLAWPPVVLSAAVLCWTAGFDIIYACQDVEFDRRVGLFSMPARLGVARALQVSTGLHALACVLFAGFGYLAGLGWGYGVAVLLTGGLLTAQHRMVRPDDLRRVNAAFFTANGMVSLVMLAGTLVDIFFCRR